MPLKWGSRNTGTFDTLIVSPLIDDARILDKVKYAFLLWIVMAPPTLYDDEPVAFEC